MRFENTRVTVLGMARSGIAAAELLQRQGATVFISEAKSPDRIPDAAAIAGRFACEFGGHSARALEADLLVTSPGVPRSADILQNALRKGVEVISEIELGWRCLHPAVHLVAVTGSNGKSTTTSLIAHLLRSCGLRSAEAGNIGLAVCGLPVDSTAYDVLVVEISSFQLEWTRDFRPDVGVILNITPDHLNRYDSFDDYAATKMRMFASQTADQHAVLPRDDDPVNRLAGGIVASRHIFAPNAPADAYVENNALVLPGAGWNFALEGMPLRGPHNILNMLASLLAVRALGHRLPALTADDLLAGLRSFRPLEHRLEPVAEINGVQYINASKATNTDSVRYALQSFTQPLRIIMGGSDKGEDFGVLLPLLRRRAACLYLLGQTGPAMAAAYAELPHVMVKTLEEAVRRAAADAQPGDVVLLSPACASYDMFDNFEQRGRAFKEAVHALTGEGND